MRERVFVHPPRAVSIRYVMPVFPSQLLDEQLRSRAAVAGVELQVVGAQNNVSMRAGVADLGAGALFYEALGKSITAAGTMNSTLEGVLLIHDGTKLRGWPSSGEGVPEY